MQNMRDVDTLLREFEASLRRVTNEISDREALNTLASALMTHDIQPSSRPCAQRALKNLQRFETCKLTDSSEFYLGHTEC